MVRSIEITCGGSEIIKFHSTLHIRHTDFGKEQIPYLTEYLETESKQQVHISGYLLTGTMHSTVTEINEYDSKSDRLTATGTGFSNHIINYNGSYLTRARVHEKIVKKILLHKKMCNYLTLFFVFDVLTF